MIQLQLQEAERHYGTLAEALQPMFLSNDAMLGRRISISLERGGLISGGGRKVVSAMGLD